MCAQVCVFTHFLIKIKTIFEFLLSVYDNRVVSSKQYTQFAIHWKVNEWLLGLFCYDYVQILSRQTERKKYYYFAFFLVVVSSSFSSAFIFVRNVCEFESFNSRNKTTTIIFGIIHGIFTMNTICIEFTLHNRPNHRHTRTHSHNYFGVSFEME